MGRGEPLLQTLPDRWWEARRAGAASERGAEGMPWCWGTWCSTLGPPLAPVGHGSPHGGSSQGGSICVTSTGFSAFRSPPRPLTELSMPPSSPQSGAIRHRWGNGCRLSQPATTVDAGRAGGSSPRGFGWGVARSRTWAGLWALRQLPRQGTTRHPQEGLSGQAPQSGALPQWVPMPGHTTHPGGSTSSSAQGTRHPQTRHPKAMPAPASTVGSPVSHCPPETARSLGHAKLVSGWQTSAGQE